MDTQPDDVKAVGNPAQIVETITESVQHILEIMFAGFNETSDTDEDDTPQFI